MLDRHVDVAHLWRLASDAARKGEKWGQRKKSVSDALESYYAQLRRDKRGAKRWVAEVVDLLGFFDASADWRAVEIGLQMLDQTDGDSPRRRGTAATRDRAGLLDEELFVQERLAGDQLARTVGGSTPSVKVVACRRHLRTDRGRLGRAAPRARSSCTGGRRVEDVSGCWCW